MSSLSIDGSQLALNAFSVGATQALSGIQSLQTDPTATQGSDTDASASGSTGPAASTHISKQGQLLSKLQQLQQQDPAKFKQVVTDIATKLQDAAKSATGDQQKFLTDLADKFQKAESGDLSGLQPPAQSANGAAALYQQNAQNAQSATGTSQAVHSGKHGHHHGGNQPGGAQSGATQSGVQQTLSGIFSELNSALGTSTSSDSASTASAQTATQTNYAVN